MPVPCEDHWRSRAASSPFRAAVSFDGDDLVLGSGTVLYKLGGVASGTISLRPDAAHDRMVALLAVAGRGRVAKAALAQLAAALDDWRRGDRGLAAIRLAFAPLPRLREPDDAYSLFLAETALDAGLSANDLLKELGYGACTSLLKFDPSQPRVPAGSGARSGQWTSGDAGAGSTGAVSRPAPVKPARDSQAGLRPTPVLFPGSPEDKERTSPEAEDWRLDIGGDEKERVEEGQPLLPATIAPGAPAPRSAVPDAGSSDLEAPGPSVAPVPRLTPTPGGGAPPPSDTPPDGNRPACPTQQNDIGRGPSPASDLFEYILSILVNPDNPTPKNSPVTPSVRSQAYFLPASTATGRISFDDCKQTSTPPLTSIPGLRPGDFLEYKSPWWNWIILNDWTTGYDTFAQQIKDQNEAVSLEGKGRQIFYCLGDEDTAKEAEKLYGKYSSSHFLVCH